MGGSQGKFRTAGIQNIKQVTPLKAVCSVFLILAIPLQAWTGPEISKKLRLTDFQKIVT
jgi:hypothetical protein